MIESNLPNAKPFSSGSEHEFFIETWCDRCTLMRYGKDGIPTNDGCETERAIAMAYFDAEKYWPQDGTLVTDDRCRTLCRKFNAKDKKLMAAYRKLPWAKKEGKAE